MRVMGDRPYPVSETFVTSAGRRSRPPSEFTDKLSKPKDISAASRRMQELAAHARESCMFRAEAINALALEKALKARNEDRVRAGTSAQEAFSNRPKMADITTSLSLLVRH